MAKIRTKIEKIKRALVSSIIKVACSSKVSGDGMHTVDQVGLGKLL